MPATLTVDHCLSGKLIRYCDPIESVALVTKELIDLCDASMIDYNNNQLALWSTGILEKYPNETIEDIALVIRRGLRGDFGQLYKTFDLGKFSEWMELHLDEKYQKKETQSNTDNSEQWTTCVQCEGKGCEDCNGTGSEYVRRVKLGDKTNQEIEQKKKERIREELTKGVNPEIIKAFNKLKP